MKMRKRFSLFCVLFVLISSCFCNALVYADSDYIAYNEPEIKFNMENAGVVVNYQGKSISNTIFCNGRLCVPLVEGVKLLNGELKSVGNNYKISCNGKNSFVSVFINSNKPKICYYNDLEYISLYELITPFDLEPIVDLSKNTVEIVGEKYVGDISNISVTGKKKAYIRLEDIVADGLKPDGTGNYTVSMLEKLKYTAEYLYNNNQEYYIAWIPVYAYPTGDYWNDVSKEYNLYNSYFLYVLDYMVDHNGHLGLHGYTHQYGSEESAVGYEWGANTPYNSNEQQKRMVLAKESCHKLGYNDEFFEFPHYGATNEQFKMAEFYFDAIYQSYPYDCNLYNCATYTDKSGKKVYYIPTPADYVHYKRDESIFDRIATSISNNYTLSLFFHPVIDENNFNIEVVDGVRQWSYNEESSLYRIVNYVNEKGYSFSNFR